MFSQSRRTFMKGVAYSSALTVGSLSSVAIAADAIVKKVPIITTEIGTEVITLVNHTASSVTFNSISGVDQGDFNQSFAVKAKKLGKNSGQNAVTIAPGEQKSFVVATQCSSTNCNANNKNLFITDVLDNKFDIRSDHSEFNGILPVTVFENLAA